MISLSYSTIANYLQENNSHNWANKKMGAKPEDHYYYQEGRIAHDIIQGHISGKAIDARLEKALKGLHFPIVEEKEFDERCMVEFFIKPLVSAEKDLLKEELEAGNGIYTNANIKNEYRIFGYVDADDPENLRFGEIKSSSTMWSLSKFNTSMQKKIYALAKPLYKEMIGITCPRDPNLWDRVSPKVYRVPLTQADRMAAFNWLLAGIMVFESGDYSGGLDEEGKCRDFRCYFGKNCQFK